MRRQLLRLTLLGSLAGALVLGSALPAAADGPDLHPELAEIYDELTDQDIADLGLVRAADNDADEVDAEAAAAIELRPELAALYDELEDDHISALARARAIDNEAEYGAEHYCIPAIVEGGSMDDCWEAPNPLLPEVNEIIWGAVGFAIVFGFIAKFGFPAMKQAMDARTEQIRSDLAQAESQRNDAEGLKAEYTAQLNDAKAEAGRILDEARQTADQLKRDREAELATELADTRERAMADIEASKAAATDELRGELASLAVGAAEAVIQRNLDATTQNQLVEEYIDRVATTSRA